MEVTEEHKTTMSLNAKTMNSIVKMHEKVLEDKSNELANILQELQSIKVTNQKLLKKIQGLDKNKNTFADNESLKRNHEVKPFSGKYCDKSFHQVHEVKKHIETHTSVSEVEDEKTKGVAEISRLLDHELVMDEVEESQLNKRKIQNSNNQPTLLVPGIYQWRIVLADSEGFQQSVSASAAEVRGRLNRPNTKFVN